MMYEEKRQKNGWINKAIMEKTKYLKKLIKNRGAQRIQTDPTAKQKQPKSVIQTRITHKKK